MPSLATALATALAAAGCGGGTPVDRNWGGGTGDDSADAAPDTGSGSTSAPRDAAPPPSETGTLVPADSGPGTSSTGGECLPGTYAGTFTCNVMAISVIQFPWSGSLSITLVGQDTMNGEFSTLTIAPGAKVSGADGHGGTFTADLTGSLDCPTRKLTGSMNNGQYLNGFVRLLFTGDLTASYDVTATPRAFQNGVMGPLVSPELPTVEGNCTWTATLQ
jgi:hypothetical protein